MKTTWSRVQDETPEYGLEVLCFNEKWVDEDFNPNGTRVGFLNGDDTWITAFYWSYQDTYMTVCKTEQHFEDWDDELKESTDPTHWLSIPDSPKVIITGEWLK